MTAVVPPRVEASADAAGFGPLVARCRHPNGWVFAFALYWPWAAMLAIYPLWAAFLAIVGPPSGEGTLPWATIVPFTAVATALGVFLAVRGVGSVTRRAFYLYPQGYLATAPSGRVVRVVRWEDVAGIDGVEGVQIVAHVLGRPRVMYQIRHLYGRPRPVKFTEVLGREVLAPLAHKLHSEAASRRTDPFRPTT